MKLQWYNEKLFSTWLCARHDCQWEKSGKIKRCWQEVMSNYELGNLTHPFQTYPWTYICDGAYSQGPTHLIELKIDILRNWNIMKLQLKFSRDSDFTKIKCMWIYNKSSYTWLLLHSWFICLCIEFIDWYKKIEINYKLFRMI
jgi:hypothetical protein